MTLYEVLIELSKSHCRFKGKHTGYADLLRFDLKNKTVSNGNTVIIKNGKVVIDELKLTDGREYTDLLSMKLIHKSDDFYEELEAIYEQYYASIPNQGAQFSKNNFIAKYLDHLSLREMVNGIPRIEAQYMLEAFVLLQTLIQDIPWSDERHFYWQGKRNNKLIIYKEWIRR